LYCAHLVVVPQIHVCEKWVDCFSFQRVLYLEVTSFQFLDTKCCVNMCFIYKSYNQVAKLVLVYFINKKCHFHLPQVDNNFILCHALASFPTIVPNHNARTSLFKLNPNLNLKIFEMLYTILLQSLSGAPNCTCVNSYYTPYRNLRWILPIAIDTGLTPCILKSPIQLTY
jgi:hypothetical protein